MPGKYIDSANIRFQARAESADSFKIKPAKQAPVLSKLDTGESVSLAT